MSVKDRIIEVINFKKIAVSTFESNSGLSNGYVKNLKGAPSATKLEDILNAYPDINRIWLLTGDGDMLLTDKKKENNSANNSANNSGVNIQAGGNVDNNNINIVAEKALDEIAEQRKLVAKSQEQIDRLLTLLEKK